MSRALGSSFAAAWFLPLLVVPLPARGAHTPGVPGWQQRVHYRIAATYTPKGFEIAGQETLTYWNQSPDSLGSLYFHLYFNAYRSGSNLARNQAWFENWTVEDLKRDRWGGQWIDRAALLGGDSLRVDVDDTVARIPLPTPLAPGESLAICLTFRSVVPDVPTRVGRAGRGVFVGQWYPKICAFDRYGWHREQHLGSEFYGDFGTFDVRLTLPGTFVVAHAGTLVNPREVLPDSIVARLEAPGDSEVTIWDRSRWTPPADSTAKRAMEAPRTWVFHADSVHEFAWAAEEKWIWRRARWSGIEICTYHRAADFARWTGLAREAGRMLSALSARFGPYPYARFTIAEEPIGAGGLEYPTAVWISPRYRIKSSRRFEAVVAHEMAHNWFYGMVGSNETEQAFLDEGLTSYAEDAVMEALYGRRANMDTADARRFWDPPADDARTQSFRSYLEFHARGIEEPVLTHADRFKNPSAYYGSSYSKTAVGLWTLRGLAGADRFDAALREYFMTWRFHHPYAEDFFALFNRAVGASYDWFFQGWFLRTDCVDVALRGIRSFPLDPARSGETLASPGGTPDSFRVEASLASRGGIDPPVVLAFRGASGRGERRSVPREAFWNAGGNALYRTTLPFEPKGAEIDPDLSLPDVSRKDNRSSRWPKLEWRLNALRPVPMPLDRTLVLARPDLWYQRENGVQAGAALEASAVRWEHALTGLVGLGTRHPRAFYDIEGKVRSIRADPRSTARARFYDMDGHQGYAVSLERDLGSRLERGSRWKAGIGVDRDRLYDRDVPRRPQEWSDGGFANLEVGLSTSRAYRRVRMTAGLRLRSDLLTERASYGSGILTASASVSALRRLPLQVRVAYGRVRGTAIPPENRLHLAGAGPRGEWRSRWFRSLGTIPTHWVAALGGDGNVRSFGDRRPSGTNLIALNVETRSGRLMPAWVPLLRGLRVPILEPKSSLFADIGNVTDEPSRLWNDLSADFGFGIRTRPLVLNRLALRCDFPIYRTPTLPDEARWKVRGVFSVGEAF